MGIPDLVCFLIAFQYLFGILIKIIKMFMFLEFQYFFEILIKTADFLDVLGFQ